MKTRSAARLALFFALPVLVPVDDAPAADEIAPLEPDAILRFECPELPPTLWSMHTGKEETPRETVRLPKNYSPDRDFPLFVWLPGAPAFARPSPRSTNAPSREGPTPLASSCPTPATPFPRHFTEPCMIWVYEAVGGNG